MATEIINIEVCGYGMKFGGAIKQALEDAKCMCYTGQNTLGTQIKRIVSIKFDSLNFDSDDYRTYSFIATLKEF